VLREGSKKMSKIIGKPITAEEVAKQIGCTPQHIYNQVKLRTIPHYKIGNAIRFPYDVVQTHIYKPAIKDQDDATG